MVALYATDNIAKFVAGLSPGAVTDAQLKTVARALVDMYSVATAARNEPAARSVQTYVAGHHGPVLASMWNNGTQMPIELAALYNGVSAHLLDFDDVVGPLHGSVSAVAIPALCALAEAVSAKGRQFAAAYIAAFEVTLKLARMLGEEPFKRGWDTTCSVGLIGTAAGCAQLMNFNKEQIAHAVALAASLATGSQEQNGFMGKAMQVGQAAATALRVIQLTRLGITASKSALDGSRGFAALMSGNSLLGKIETIGQAPLEIDIAGIDIKRFPCNYACHGAIDAMLEMRSSYGVTAGDIVKVEVTMHPNALRPLAFPRPLTASEARYSMQYAVAAAVLDGKVNLQSFTDAMVQRNEAQGFFNRVTVIEDEAGPEFPRATTVKLSLKSGASAERRIDVTHGSARSPLTEHELAEKARECFTHGKSEVWAKDFMATAFGMATTPIRDVLRAGRSG
jgi:2-methylcitrate dehydratase PrpD